MPLLAEKGLYMPAITRCDCLGKRDDHRAVCMKFPALVRYEIGGPYVYKGSRDKMGFKLDYRCGKRGSAYFVEEERVQDASELMQWVLHLSQKTWITPVHIHQFILAVKGRWSEDTQPIGADQGGA